MMYDLVGVRQTWIDTYDDEYRGPDEQVVVATFDLEDTAKAYLEASYLKQPHSARPFRVASLLSGFESAYVEERKIPHNPSIGW